MSQESIESSSTGDEFVVVNGEPKLKVTGDFSDIGDAMMSDSTVCDTRLSSSPGSPEDSKDLSHVIPSSQSVGFLADDLGLGDMTESQEDQSGAGNVCQRILQM